MGEEIQQVVRWIEKKSTERMEMLDNSVAVQPPFTSVTTDTAMNFVGNMDESTKDRTQIQQAVSEEKQSDVKTIVSNSKAFAALKLNGNVFTWGDDEFGGDSTKVKSELQSGVVQTIFSTRSAFAALSKNGKVITWGCPRGGGEVITVNNPFYTGDSEKQHELQFDVQSIVSTDQAFAALKLNGKVITWGMERYGGDSSEVEDELQSEVQSIVSTRYGFAALKSNGKVITWGPGYYSAKKGERAVYFSSKLKNQLQSGVKTILCTEGFFAALKTNGKVITWGKRQSRFRKGDVSFLESGIISIEKVGTDKNTIRATKSDKSYIEWN